MRIGTLELLIRAFKAIVSALEEECKHIKNKYVFKKEDDINRRSD